MNLSVDVRLSIMKLYNGKRSFYASVSIGRKRIFISRWDTARVVLKPRQIDIYRSQEMTWYAGAA